MEKVYIIGHKNPDLDSIAAAIAYADYKNKTDKTGEYEYIPSAPGGLNAETKYVLEKFGIPQPELTAEAKDKNFILVDHNERSQSIDNMAEAKIFEILDHHKMDFKYSEPILVDVRPWGSSASIVMDKFSNAGIEPEKSLAGLMLSAVLVDTVIAKSPTCTRKDKDIIEKLAGLAGISDWRQFGMEIFRVRSNVKDMPAADIIKSDFKDFEFKSGKFGIGQVETVDLGMFADKESELMEELEKLRQKESYHSVILFITDIINEGSKFLVSTSDQNSLEQAIGADLENGKVYIKGIISRKKQVAPKFTEIFDK